MKTLASESQPKNVIEELIRDGWDDVNDDQTAARLVNSVDGFNTKVNAALKLLNSRTTAPQNLGTYSQSQDLFATFQIDGESFRFYQKAHDREGYGYAWISFNNKQLKRPVTANIAVRRIRTWPLNPYMYAAEENWRLENDPSDPHGVNVVAVYNGQDKYVGDLKHAKWLQGLCIRPQVATSSNNVCSVGYCKPRNAWAGWSHRALCFFGFGDMVFDAEYEADRYGFLEDPRPFTERGSVVIESLEQAREAACNFADYIG